MPPSRVSLSVVSCFCIPGSLESIAGQQIQDEAGSWFGIPSRNVHFMSLFLIHESSGNASLEWSLKTLLEQCRAQAG